MIEPAPAHPLQWSATFSGAPVLASEPSRWKSARLARWTGTDPRMPQPPLSHHVLVLHLGGDKRVRRSGDGLRRQFDVAQGAVSLIPARCGFNWLTRGPVDFAHLYIHPDRLDRTVVEVFDRDPSTVVLQAPVGADDRLLQQLAATILREVEADRPSRAYLDSMLDAALVQIVQRYSNVGDIQDVARHTLAPARLRRVLDHIERALFGPLDLTGLAEVAGLSRFHFSRAFQRSVGEPPLAYVARRRIETAKTLLRSSALPVADIAARSGFASASYFSTAFRRHTGHSPSEYRYDKT